MGKRTATKYTGVFYRENRRIGGRGNEKVYYVVYMKDGKVVEEKAGRQYVDKMTPTKAALIRAELIEGRRSSRKEKRKLQNIPTGGLDACSGTWNVFGDALNYEKFRQSGFPVGSGEIESAHKSIPQKRLKVPGACWHPESVDPMLALRLLRANGWWDDFWNTATESRIAA